MLPPKDQMDQMKQQQDRFREAEPTEEPRGIPGFGPPEFEDEVDEAYADWHPEEDEELEQPYDEEETPEPQEDYGFTPPPEWTGTREYQEPPSLKQDGNRFLNDQPAFPGGPMRSEIASWKKTFEQDDHTVNLSEPGGEPFIWRTLSRTEYREIMALQNTDPLQREEIICEICTLFPYDYNFSNMASRKAGIPAVLAEQIMQESGFKKPAPPIRL
jgi:hypothetical protein